MRNDITLRKERSLHGFTLVELLATIGVIVLLAVLIFPAAQKANSRALTTKSISNLRQVGLAILTYANDNDGKLPDKLDSSLYAAASQMDPYLKRDDPAWICPLTRKQMNNTKSGTVSDRGRMVYNWRLGNPTSGWSRGSSLPIRLNTIRTPSQAMLAANLTNGARGGWWDGFANVLFADGSVRRKSDNSYKTPSVDLGPADPGPTVVAEFISLQPGKGLKGFDY